MTDTAPRKIRLEDVARAAGVSAATASRALNQPDIVSEALRQQVETVARKLGYVAHGAARALASRRSATLGALVPTLSNAIFADAINAFQNRLERRGYTMLIATSDYDEEKEFRRARTMMERGIDGIMLVGATHDPALLDMLRRAAMPYVQILASPKGSDDPSIGYDHAALSAVIVDHLVELGHRDVMLVTGASRHNDRVVARIAGMRRALRRHGLSLPAARVIQTSYLIGDARKAFREAQRRGALPTAMVANNDVIATGLLLEAIAQDIKVPQQLSIVGIGDLDLAGNMVPPLTTVRTPRAQFGTLAADYLLSRILDEPFALPGELPIEFVIRGTTAPPGFKD